MKVFVSYARASAPPKAVLAFHKHLEAELRLLNPRAAVFVDHTIPVGAHFPSELKEHLDESTALLVLLSPAWLRSQWCRNEFNLFTRNARDAERLRRVIPVLWAATPDASEASDDVVARALAESNWSDWTALRHRSLGSTAMGPHFARLAQTAARLSQYSVTPTAPLRDALPATSDDLALPRPEALVYGPDSSYSKDVRSLMIEVLQPAEIHIDRFIFNDNATISDLTTACTRVLYPRRDAREVERSIVEARRAAYTRKYGLSRQDDEKIALDSVHGPWTSHLAAMLAAKGVDGIESARVLDVGLGTAQAYGVDSFFSRLRRFTAVDVSEQALAAATSALPNLRPVVADAENLGSALPNGSQDVYLSFRTFNSTLLHRRRAVWEAFRVLSAGGVAVVSIPRIYYSPRTGEVFPGLGNSERKISLQYLYRVVNDVRQHFEVLGFRDVDTADTSPYEIFVFARRS